MNKQKNSKNLKKRDTKELSGHTTQGTQNVQNLTRQMQDLYAKNYKIFFQEIKDLSKWKDIPC